MTTDELFGLGLERTQQLTTLINDGRGWYTGRRSRQPDQLISSYFEPKKGPAIDYFRKTIRHLANGGFKKANMKSDAAVAFRQGNTRVLATMKELEPLLSQHLEKADADALRLALFFFRSGQDMFFDMLPRFEPIIRPTIKKLKVEAFCIDSLQRYLGAVARAFAIREAQLTGKDARHVPRPAKPTPPQLPPAIGFLYNAFAQSLNRQQDAKRNQSHFDRIPLTSSEESQTDKDSVMFAFEKRFIVIGQPNFADPTKDNPDFGKALEAVTAAQGISFGETGLYPPIYFPDSEHPHFEFRIFKGRSTDSEYEPINFDFIPSEGVLRVYSAIPEIKARPIVDFIANNYLGTPLEERKNTTRDIIVQCRSMAPNIKRFEMICEMLSNQIISSIEKNKTDIENQWWMRDGLSILTERPKMPDPTRKGPMRIGFDHPASVRIAEATRGLYESLHAWISECHPEQFDTYHRDYNSLAGQVLDIFENLNTEDDWVYCLFTHSESPTGEQYNLYNPKTFELLLDVCSKNGNTNMTYIVSNGSRKGRHISQKIIPATSVYEDLADESDYIDENQERFREMANEAVENKANEIVSKITSKIDQSNEDIKSHVTSEVASVKSKDEDKTKSTKRRAGVSVVMGREAHPAINVESGAAITVFTKDKKETRYRVRGAVQWDILNRFLSSIKNGENNDPGSYHVPFTSLDFNKCKGVFRTFIKTFVEPEPLKHPDRNKQNEPFARFRVELLGNPAKDARVGPITDAKLEPKKRRKKA